MHEFSTCDICGRKASLYPMLHKGSMLRLREAVTKESIDDGCATCVAGQYEGDDEDSLVSAIIDYASALREITDLARAKDDYTGELARVIGELKRELQDSFTQRDLDRAFREGVESVETIITTGTSTTDPSAAANTSGM